ncbi:MAG: HAD family phosphatase [Deltaproteobacteria bacterium]|nr:HAD family phosphatase [Deltaproteobacteria bacterium]
MPLALFDLDRTLISVNSGKLWVQRELSLGHVSRWQAMRAAAWISGYHLGFTRLEQVVLDAIATLEGATEGEIRDRTEAFYAEMVASTYRPGARQVVSRHKEQGDVVALLTTSSNYLCAPVQREFGIDHALCNRFEVRDGAFTGKPDGPICFGAGKLHHARAFAEAQRLPLEEASFYTDSVSDLPVLEVVKTPVAVNPDPRLRRVARQRGWEIVDWG